MMSGRSCPTPDCSAPAVGGLSRCTWVTLLAPLAVGLLLLLSGCSGSADGAQESPAALGAQVESPSTRTPIPLDSTEPIAMRVYSSPTCGCCSLWVEHLEENGFEVETQYRDDMGQVKVSFGITQQLASCHTGIVNGYLIEGHVPADDIRRLLAEAPDTVRGLAVPGMPIGSPGMEMGDRVDPYDVLAIGTSGELSVFARYGR
jgi:hypothetical protein